VTKVIPDSWELPSYLAGGVYHMEGWRERRGPLPDQPEGNEAEIRKFPQGRRAKPRRKPAQQQPERSWSGSLGDVGFPPEHHEPGELYNQDDLDALKEAGFEPHDRGVWHRRIPGAPRDVINAGHYLYYNPGRVVGDKKKPWHLTKDPEEQGRDFASLRGMSGALSNLQHFSSAFPDWTKFGAKATPGQSAADKWLADNDNDDWMREREGDPDEGYTHWDENHIDPNDPYSSTYSDVADPAGQRFRDGEEPESTAVGTAFRPGHDWDRFHEERERRWSPEDLAAQEHVRSHMPATRQDGYADDDDSDPPQHEQDLADLGFNWQHRGDPDNTPVGIYQEGMYVRHQHDPEGRHVATHVIYRNPNNNSWNTDSTDPSDSNFSYDSSQHQWPHDAISRYREL